MIIANTSAIWLQVAHTTYQLPSSSSVAAQQNLIKKKACLLISPPPKKEGGGEGAEGEFSRKVKLGQHRSVWAKKITSQKEPQDLDEGQGRRQETGINENPEIPDRRRTSDIHFGDSGWKYATC